MTELPYETTNRSDPLVSVIVPVYKVPEGLLRRCIESVLAQTMEQVEIILVDDGSPDECGAICDEYAHDHSRVIVIHKDNGGLSAARNSGQRMASAKWIMFVDGDDWIEPDMCESLYAIAARDCVQLVMCGFSKDYSGTQRPYRFSLRDGKVYSGIECRGLQASLLKYNENLATAYAKLIDRALLLERGIEHDETLRQGAEGLEFNMRLFDVLQAAAFTARPLYHYVYNSASISSSHDEANHRYVLACFDKIRRLVESSDNRAVLLPWLRNRLLYVVVTTAVSGYFNPGNPEPYGLRKRAYTRYLETPIIGDALASGRATGMSLSRRVVLYLVRRRMFWALDLAGKARYWQKRHR
ncbi:MAG: glycosyltransferase [Coriobacteriia bacterium]|nr:glycosyltransferase [Coriobacteriia bacterium]